MCFLVFHSLTKHGVSFGGWVWFFHHLGPSLKATQPPDLESCRLKSYKWISRQIRWWQHDWKHDMVPLLADCFQKNQQLKLYWSKHSLQRIVHSLQRICLGEQHELPELQRICCKGSGHLLFGAMPSRNPCVLRLLEEDGLKQLCGFAFCSAGQDHRWWSSTS